MVIVVGARHHVTTLKNLSIISRCCSAYVSFVSRLWGFDQLVLSTSISFATAPPIVIPAVGTGVMQRGACSCILISIGVQAADGFLRELLLQI